MLSYLRFPLMGLLLSLTACAPVILGRTPTPAGIGENEVYIAGGGSLSVTPLNGCSEPESLCLPWLEPDYWPKAASLQIMNAWGYTPDTEFNSTIMLLPLPGYRFGGKTLLEESSLRFGVDYGASLLVSNVGLDAGFLASAPFSGGEVYGGLRGFGSVYWTGQAGLSAALTLGLLGQLAQSRAFVEVTVSTGHYNGLEPTTDVSPTGIIITPALGIYF